MGFRISWLAFQGKSRSDVLASLHLNDTKIHDDANACPISAASFPGEWTVIFLNRFDHPFTDDASLVLLSKDCTVICGHIHEGIMFSSAQRYSQGKNVWSVFHESSKGMYHIEVDGTPPDSFEEIRTRLVDKQKQEGGEDSSVDYVFNVPVELAKSLCGFEYCRYRYEWGEPHFSELRARSELQ